MRTAIIVLVSVKPDDLHEVDSVFNDLQTFSKRVDGVPKRSDAAKDFMPSLPPGHDPRKKHVFLAKIGEKAIGLLDIVADYPAPGTAFIGLLAIRESMHGTGLGRALCHAAEDFAQEHLKAKVIQLAVVESNPALEFWTKIGFRPAGEERLYQGERQRSRAILMQKLLIPQVD